MKLLNSLIGLSLVIAFTCASAEGEIIRNNRGVKKLLPGNQITVSGNGAGVVTVGVDGAIAVDSGTLSANYSSFTVAQIAFNSGVNDSTGTLRTAITTTTKRLEAAQIGIYGSTDTLNTRISTMATDVYNTFSTHSSVNYQQSLDSGTLQSAVAVATGGFKSDYSLFATSVSALAISARTSTDNFRTEISTTITEMKTLAVPLSLYDEGASQGNGILTTINCVGSNISCTQATATGTITITGGTDTNYRTATVYLATAGAVSGSADIFDSCGSTNAINAVGALGLVGGSSVTATILVREGVYKAPNATTIIPKGIDFGGVAGSSTVWVLTQTNKSMFKVYGTLHDLIIDCSSLAITGLGTDAGILDLRQGGTLENIYMYNCSNHAANNRAPHLFISSDWTADGGVAPSSTVARIKNVTLEKLGATEALSNTGDGGPVTIRYAQRVEIDGLKILGHGRQVANEAPMVIMYQSSWVYFNRLTMEGIGRSMGFMTYGEMGPFGINDSDFILRPGDASQSSRGVINFFIGNTAPTSLEISTGMYITNSRFYNYTGGNFGAAWIQTYTTKLVMNGIIRGNIVHSPTETTDTFIGLADSARNWTIADNYVTGFGTFISDSGAGTKYTGLGNFKNGIEE